MTTIIRAPEIPEQKRKLSSRRTVSQDTNLGQTVGENDNTSIAPDPLQALVDKARQSVLAQFKSEAEEAREHARQRGLREGRAAGADEAKQSFAAERARMRALCDSISQSLASGLVGLEEIEFRPVITPRCPRKDLSV